MRKIKIQKSRDVCVRRTENDTINEQEFAPSCVDCTRFCLRYKILQEFFLLDRR